MDYREALYTDGFQPLLIVCIKVEGNHVIRRAIISPEFLKIMPECPAIASALHSAVEDVIEMGKPLDDRKLRPGLQAEVRE